MSGAPLIRALRPYRSRTEFVRDAARLVLEGGPVVGDAPVYGLDEDVQILAWPEEVRRCPTCRADCKRQALRAARRALDEGRRVELVITAGNDPAHMATRIDGVLCDPSEHTGGGHAPDEIWVGAIIVGVDDPMHSQHLEKGLRVGATATQHTNRLMEQEAPRHRRFDAAGERLAATYPWITYRRSAGQVVTGSTQVPAAVVALKVADHVQHFHSDSDPMGQALRVQWSALGNDDDHLRLFVEHAAMALRLVNEALKGKQTKQVDDMIAGPPWPQERQATHKNWLEWDRLMTNIAADALGYRGARPQGAHQGAHRPQGASRPPPGGRPPPPAPQGRRPPPPAGRAGDALAPPRRRPPHRLPERGFATDLDPRQGEAVHSVHDDGSVALHHGAVVQPHEVAAFYDDGSVELHSGEVFGPPPGAEPVHVDSATVWAVPVNAPVNAGPGGGAPPGQWATYQGMTYVGLPPNTLFFPDGSFASSGAGGVMTTGTYFPNGTWTADPGSAGGDVSADDLREAAAEGAAAGAYAAIQQGGGGGVAEDDLRSLLEA